MSNTAQIREQALALPEDERAELARELFQSLDGDLDPQAQEQWAKVIEARAREVIDGTADVVDGRSAFTRIRAKLNNR